MIKAVIFDFDDTLCLTKEDYIRLENKALKHFGKKQISRQELEKHWGTPLTDYVKNCYPDLDFEEFKRILDEVYLPKFVASGQMDKVPEENLEALDQLARQGKQLMVLTARNESAVIHLMDPEHHIGSRVAAFYHHGNNPYSKPDPKTFDVLRKYHELQPTECIYVGDRQGDAAAAKKAGLYFIATLESGFFGKNDFADYEVDEFINKLPEVVVAVGRIEKNTSKDVRTV
jgi:phosphoglycolate phosphatase